MSAALFFSLQHFGRGHLPSADDDDDEWEVDVEVSSDDEPNSTVFVKNSDELPDTESDEDLKPIEKPHEEDSSNVEVAVSDIDPKHVESHSELLVEASPFIVKAGGINTPDFTKLLTEEIDKLCLN